MPRKPMTLGDEDFATQGEAKARINDILWDLNDPVHLGRDDKISLKAKSEQTFQIVLDWCKRRNENWESKRLTDVVDIEIRRDGTGWNKAKGRECRCFWLVHDDHTVTHFSKNKVTQSVATSSLHRFRDAIWDQIAAFKQNKYEQALPDLPKCEECDKPVEGKDAHVDHNFRGGRTFLGLAIAFSEAVGLTVNTMPTVQVSTAHHGSQMQSNYRDQFRQFHLQEADLRLLCKTCNLTEALGTSKIDLLIQQDQAQRSAS